MSGRLAEIVQSIRSLRKSSGEVESSAFGLRLWRVERAYALWDKIAGNPGGDEENQAWQAVREYKDASDQVPDSAQARAADEAAIHAIGQAVLWGYAQGLADSQVGAMEVEMALEGGLKHIG